jgi:hypothetical protein
MKLRDAILKVNKSKENTTSADIDTFSQAVSVDAYMGWNEEWDHRVTGYWLIRWLCTDTWVGTRVYYLDGKPVAVGHQSARKSDELIEFTDRVAAEYIRNLILKLHNTGEPEFSLLDQEEDVPDVYNFDLTDYFLENKGFVEGVLVDIVEKRYFKPDEKKRYICEHCKVKLPSGEECVVRADEVYFPIRVV